MEGRISATGLKSVEIDELTTNQIIINNEGLQYYHNYNILLPTVTEGYYNLQEELDNIMISNTTQDLELIQLQSGLSSAQASITTLGVLAGTANTNALAAINLANQKSWILFFQKPLRCDISNNIYLDFDTNYFNIDASNNLTLNNLWKKDISNNLYFTSGKVGIGLTNPGANYKLDVLGNINCSEIYRNGTPISSTLSLFLPLTGGTLSGILTGTTISATNMSASLFSGSGASLTNINASNISSGILSVSQGGIGTTSLSSNQILIGNGTSILQSANLAWNNTSNTLSATNFSGSGASLTNINASNISSGTLSVSQGGIGTTSLSSNQILIGNGTSILQSANLAWNNTSNTLSVSNLQMSGQITGVTTLNGTTGLFGKLQTTNNTNVGNPSVGVAGGTGDKLILYAGTATLHPCSLGLNVDSMWYSVTTGASHRFYNGGTNTLTIDSSGNIDCGGGIALTGSNAFAWEADIVDAGNKTNTYINFRNAGASSDWCYLRQIGISNTYKLAFDFHDDGNDARFCIRNVQSAGVTTDIITEVFTVDNGNVSFTGELKSSYWKLTNQSDYCRLYNLAGTAYFKFAASDLWAESTLSVGTTASIGGQLTAPYIGINGTNTTYRLYVAGKTYIGNSCTITADLDVNGGVLNVSASQLKGYCVANFHNNHPYAVSNNYMAYGSLTIGGTTANYGSSTGWSSSTAGLMMECADVTEIVVHDSGTRLASLLYYYGPTNQIYIGRDKGWGVSSVFIGGYLQCLFYTVDYVGYDKVGVADTTGTGRNESRQMYQIWNSFTDFHRCFIDDELFNKDNPQEFKDIYMGRIVVSTGTIKTHSSKIKTGEQPEWEIKIGKEAITIEDAHPMIELSRKKRDKRVLGVLGLNTRKNSHPERLIVNAIGEGGIWVCNSNGIIENGDYITSSDYLGYGEKQDDDLLHNYTVAKATMDCNFELDSNLYICLELESGIKIAFIAVTYHCG